MRPETIDDESGDKCDSGIYCVFDHLGTAREEAEVGAGGIGTDENCDGGKNIGRRVAVFRLPVDHRVQDDADDRRDQEHVLGQQHDGFVLHEQPQNAEYRQAQQVDGPLTADRPEDLLCQSVRIGWLGVAAQVFLAVAERYEADDHADTGGAETVLPAEGFAEPAT